jgi:hypothetical protein
LQSLFLVVAFQLDFNILASAHAGHLLEAQRMQAALDKSIPEDRSPWV